MKRFVYKPDPDADRKVSEEHFKEMASKIERISRLLDEGLSVQEVAGKMRMAESCVKEIVSYDKEGAIEHYRRLYGV